MFERTRLITKMAVSLPRVMRHKPDSPYTMADVLEAKAAEYGDRPFVLFEDRRVSYREINEEANRVAHWAYELGLRRGDVVALLMENRPEYLTRWMGLGKLGVPTALLNTNVAPLIHQPTYRIVAHASRRQISYPLLRASWITPVPLTDNGSCCPSSGGLVTNQPQPCNRLARMARCARLHKLSVGGVPGVTVR